MYEFIQILTAVIYGIVEGITEWLPVSSTGHLILLDEFLSFSLAPDAVFTAEFCEMFDVVIQLGAILAVVVTYFSRLWPLSPKKGKSENIRIWKLWGKVLIASVPAALAGIVFDKILEKISGKDIDGWLYNAPVVVAALIIYGVFFILIEKFNKKKAVVESVDDITVGQSLAIGVFQMLAIIPGTSRSGSTILGSMLIGLSRTAAAEFSFFMAIPAMAGASLIKALGFVSYVAEFDVAVPALAWVILAVGCAVAFGVSMVAIKFLTDFVKKHSFIPFGVYRIILGAALIVWFLVK
ncbi:MAG: undecaprenyl-diphosphate phosphatase [Clostridia bacterium]|nr:undecaprenyl-diphosphate phosphatase [Clostridia bacterium]